MPETDKEHKPAAMPWMLIFILIAIGVGIWQLDTITAFFQSFGQ